MSPVTGTSKAIEVAAHREDDQAVAFLHDLVRTPSVSGDERAAAECFIAEAARLGLESRIDEAGNAIATRRSAAARAEAPIEIVLLGHIDTVPGAIPVRIEGETLHGRGAVDAKGPLAAMLYAAASAMLPPGVAIHVIGAVGEETPRSPGARHLLGRYRPAACIIGEPSGTGGVVLGYKGRLIVEAEFLLESTHSAGPHGSAPDAAHAWWSAVLSALAPLNEGRRGAFPTVQASIRAMSSDSDGMHDRARLAAGFRLPPHVTPDALEALIRAIASPVAPRLTFDGHTPAFESTRSDPVASALTAAIRDEGLTPRPLLKTGTADMNLAGPAWRCPIAAYGPGDSALDHTPHERINLDDYRRATRVLTRALETLARSLTQP